MSTADTSSLKIREATLEDVPHLASFMIAMAKETESKELDPDTVTLGAKNLIVNPKYGRYLVTYIPSVGDD